MKHIVFLDHRALELMNILNRSKTMIIRASDELKHPHGKVNNNDILYFLNNNGEGFIKAQAKVSSVLHSKKLSREESISLLNRNLQYLKLSETQHMNFSGKFYIVLIKVAEVKAIEPVKFDKSKYPRLDWIILGN